MFEHLLARGVVPRSGQVGSVLGEPPALDRSPGWPHTVFTQPALPLAHLIQVLGEAARRVSLAFQRAHPEIPKNNIVGMRHKVVHDGISIDEDFVWQATMAELPSVIAALDRIVPPEDVW